MKRGGIKGACGILKYGRADPGGITVTSSLFHFTEVLKAYLVATRGEIGVQEETHEGEDRN